MLIVKAPMRLSISGGGSDLPAFLDKGLAGQTLTTTLNKFVYVTINPSSHTYSRFVYSSIEEHEDLTEINHSILRNLIKRNSPRSHIELFSMADLPAKGTGLGASSAFCLASTAALTRYNERFLSALEIAQEASIIEMKMCGYPSGFQDQYASALGSVSLLNFSSQGLTSHSDLIADNVLPTDTIDWLNSHSVFIRVPGERDSAKILTNVKFREKSEDRAQKEIVELNKVMIRCIQLQDSKSLGRSLSINWELKKIVNPESSNRLVDELYEEGIRQGAYGGKLLGAGGSGYLFFIVENRSAFLARLNVEDLEISITGEGMKVIEV
jgi:D-glycero-alpha-D-manno-heptose-7-phosphate kinase